jgi:hypothetical protein
MRTLLFFLALSMLAAAPAATAQQAASPSYRLDASTVGAGGGVGLRGPGSTPAVGQGGTTLGQSTPAGVAQGATSGVRLEAGFWSLVPVPEPGAGLQGVTALLVLARLRRIRARR